MRHFLAAFSLSKRATKSVDATAALSANATTTDTKPALPAWRDDVEEFVPPPVRHVIPRDQAEALVAMLQGENRFGPVPCWEVVALYPECAWMHGFVHLTERQLHQALSQVCTKVRRDVFDGGRKVRAVCYVIPEPFHAVANKPERASEPGNVVALATKRSKIPNGSRLSARASRVKVAHPKGQRRKGGRYSADIQEAVACQR